MSRGRPTLRSNALVIRIIARIENGANPRDAAEAEGVKVKTFAHWLRHDPELRARVLEAQAKALRT